VQEKRRTKEGRGRNGTKKVLKPRSQGERKAGKNHGIGPIPAQKVRTGWKTPTEKGEDEVSAGGEKKRNKGGHTSADPKDKTFFGG